MVGVGKTTLYEYINQGNLISNSEAILKKELNKFRRTCEQHNKTCGQRFYN